MQGLSFCTQFKNTFAFLVNIVTESGSCKPSYFCVSEVMIPSGKSISRWGFLRPFGPCMEDRHCLLYTSPWDDGLLMVCYHSWSFHVKCSFPVNTSILHFNSYKTPTAVSYTHLPPDEQTLPQRFCPAACGHGPVRLRYRKYSASSW